MTRAYVGIDCEMSGTDYLTYRLIQVGFSLDARDESKCFKSDIGWEVGDFEYQPEALRVNRFTVERITSGPSSTSVEGKLLAWFEEMGLKEASIIPVGFAVRTFDMPFIDYTFSKEVMGYFIRPKPRGLPSDSNPYLYRCSDLTDYTLGMAYGIERRQRKLYGEMAWKRAGKEYAQRELAKVGVEPDWHDALYDARAALLQMEFYSNQRLRPSEAQMRDLLGKEQPS